MKALTDRQQEVYDFLVEAIVVNQRPPTVREIGDELGITSPNGVRNHLIVLEEKGYIEIVPRTARGIKLVTGKGLRCPYCGKELR